MRTVVEPYSPVVAARLVELGVDHAIAALLDGDRVVGFTMCHPAGPRHERLRCGCAGR